MSTKLAVDEIPTPATRCTCGHTRIRHSGGARCRLCLQCRTFVAEWKPKRVNLTTPAPTAPPEAPAPEKSCAENVGTVKGFWAHMKAVEKPCKQCRAGYRDAHPQEPTTETLDDDNITRAMAGENVTLSHAERREAIRRLGRLGMDPTEIGWRVGVTRRTVVRRLAMEAAA